MKRGGRAILLREKPELNKTFQPLLNRSTAAAHDFVNLGGRPGTIRTVSQQEEHFQLLE
jgi:hypothetical protein